MSSNEDFPVLTSASQIRVEVARELVTVPEWKARVWVQELTGKEIDEYRQPMYVTDGGKFTMSLKESGLRLLALSLVDANSNKLYPNTERGVKELGVLPAGGTERLAKVARRLSRLSDDDDAPAAGNSDTEMTDDSTSDSPDTSVAPSLNS